MLRILLQPNNENKNEISANLLTELEIKVKIFVLELFHHLSTII